MERQYFYTERAHLMCPNMNFGIISEINSPFDENKIRHTLSVLVYQANNSPAQKSIAT